jgi:hypothetical protein
MRLPKFTMLFSKLWYTRGHLLLATALVLDCFLPYLTIYSCKIMAVKLCR